MLSEFRQLLSEDEIRAKITTIMMKHDKEDSTTGSTRRDMNASLGGPLTRAANQRTRDFNKGRREY